MAELKISEVFTESANRLPKDAKIKLFKVFSLLTKNPRHPSLQLKKIQGAARKDIYECRVDRFWRLIIQDLGGTLYKILYVGPHDEAIEHGAMLLEPLTPYGGKFPDIERVRSYLTGDNEALKFKDISEEELKGLLEIE